VLVAIPDAARPGGIKALDLGTIAFFAVVSILALALDRKEFSWFEDWSQFISSMVLAAIAFVSLAFTASLDPRSPHLDPADHLDRWCSQAPGAVHRVFAHTCRGARGRCGERGCRVATARIRRGERAHPPGSGAASRGA
jgi:hypothetical protein